MEEADVALNDEGQQYGNLDEASATARVPRKCLVVWCGDHKQTPGGLRKTDDFFFSSLAERAITAVPVTALL